MPPYIISVRFATTATYASTPHGKLNRRVATSGRAAAVALEWSNGP